MVAVAVSGGVAADAKPAALTVAIAELEEDQVTVDVISFVELSL